MRVEEVTGLGMVQACRALSAGEVDVEHDDGSAVPWIDFGSNGVVTNDDDDDVPVSGLPSASTASWISASSPGLLGIRPFVSQARYARSFHRPIHVCTSRLQLIPLL